MTQPDQNLPESAVNYDSLAAHAAKTQTEWETENRNALAAQFDQAVEGMVKLLGPIPILGDLLEIFTGKEDGDYNDFGTAFNKWKNFWGGNLKGLLDAIEDLFAPVKDFVDGVAGFGQAVDDAVKDTVKFFTEGAAFIGGGIAATMAAVGKAIGDGLQGTQATFEALGRMVFGIPTPEQFQGSIDGAVTWLDTAGQALMDLLGLNQVKADTAITNNQLTNAKIYEGYFGVGGSGEVAQAQETIAAIKTKIFEGFTLETMTVSTGTQFQQLAILNATGGSFTITYDGQTTSAISNKSSASTVQLRLEELSTIGAGNVTVNYVVTDASRYNYNILIKQRSTYKLFKVNPESLTGSGVSVLTIPHWARPWKTTEAPKEMFCMVFGSGGGGGAGERRTTNNASETGTSDGGQGGAPGGYLAVELDAAALPDLVYFTVASGGLGQTATTSPSSGAETNFGGLAVSQSGEYFVRNLLGYYTTNQSAPGAGGAGGAGFGSGVRGRNGVAGGSSPLAAGGAGGNGTNVQLDQSFAATSYTSPTPGTIGTTATLDGKSRAGGGGGGGGGGAWVLRSGGTNYVPTVGVSTTTAPYNGRLGGNGGFPGGGAGGGGGALTVDTSDGAAGIVPGNGGIGGNGIIILLYR